MSSKPTTSKGESSKLPTIMETVVTRRKSAQQKRQLRNKDSSIKRISQFAKLLLSPTKTNTSKSPPMKSKSTVSKNLLTGKTKSNKEKVSEKKDVKKSPKKAKIEAKVPEKAKSPEIVDTVTEYRPEKLKRVFEGKKVVLKPKHEMKVVVGTRIGKRKLVLPQKGADGLRSPPSKLQKPTPKSPPKPRPPRLELSIEDLVHLHNDEMLDDEDWMEILTCPSPVWWEDPPDPCFDEEPKTINVLRTVQLPVKTKTTELQEAETNVNETKPDKTHLQNKGTITEVLSEGNVKILEMKKSDVKFMRKRSKLENLLGNIRNKINDCDQSGLKDNKNNSTDSKKFDRISTKESDIIKKAESVKLKLIESDKPDSVSNSNSSSPVPKKEKRTSESTEEDPFSCFRDEDLLNDLENIDIPIKTEDNSECDKEAESFLEHSNKNLKDKVNTEDISDCNSLQDRSEDSNAAATFRPPFREGISQISKLTTTSIEKDTSGSPTSTKSLISISDENYETTSVKSQDIDTISDTNIKFIDEDDECSSRSCLISDKNEKSDEVKENNEISSVKGSSENQEPKSCSIENVSRCNTANNPRKEKDCMTVYKIISNEKDSNKTNNDTKNNNNMLSKINEMIKESKEYNNFKVNLKSNEASSCMTVYKLISNEKDSNKINNDTKNNNNMLSKINELIKASKEYNNFKVNLKSNEASISKLDSFYKKFKNHQSRQVKKPESIKNNSTETLHDDDKNINNNESSNEKIVNIDEKETTNEKTNRSATDSGNNQINDENNDNDNKKSIVVSNTSCKIKYCMKCSCIFDTDDCNYCVEKKVLKKQENSEVEKLSCETCSFKSEKVDNGPVPVSEH